LKALLPRLKPLEPDEALRSFRTDQGFHIELAAAEPAVTDPIAGAFDENGRLYVAEMGDYPSPPKEGERPFGRVRLLEDTDGDGKADVKKKVYTGFVTNQHTYAVLNNLHWGLDNKIYGVSSYRGGSVRRVEKPGAPVSVRQQGFRFDPVSGAFEAVPGNAEF